MSEEELFQDLTHYWKETDGTTGFQEMYPFFGFKNHDCGGKFPYDREIGSSQNSIVYVGGRW